MMLRAFWTAVLVLGVLGVGATGAAVSARIRGSRADSGGGVQGDRGSQPAVRHVLGNGLSGPVGKTFENAPNIDWQRSEGWPTTRGRSTGKPGPARRPSTGNPGRQPACVEVRPRMLSMAPRPRKCLGRRTSSTGSTAWRIDGTGTPVPVPPELAEIYQLDIWLDPAQGFSKPHGSRAPTQGRCGVGSSSKKGRDGNVVTPEKVHAVGITVLGKYRVDATINSQNASPGSRRR